MVSDTAITRIQDKAGIFLLLLVVTDISFIVADLIARFSDSVQQLYFLGTDRGYAELFQYIQTYWAIIMLGILLWRSRERLYFAWIFVYTYILLDDSLQIHEYTGYFIAKYFGLGGILGLRSRDIGELMVYGSIGLIVFTLILLLYPRSADRVKASCKDLLLLTGLLVLFGVGFDMLDIVINNHYIAVMIGIIEDGGEMIAMSLICWYIANLTLNNGLSSVQLWPNIRDYIYMGSNKTMKCVWQLKTLAFGT